MKTAVSVPDDLFKKADRLARRQRKSRSRLYADAVAEYVQRHDPDWITARLNEIADELDTSIDPAITAATRELWKREPW